VIRVLLIIPKFFSYENYIKNELEKLGYNVYMIYENPDEFSFKAKFQINLLNNKQKYYDKYFKKKIKNKRFDIVLAIRAAFLSESTIEYIRTISPGAKFYMYQWDSIKNNHNALVISALFDKVMTFDIDDSKKYGWKYRPLFYIKSADRSEKRKYDISFIATLHSKRVKIYQIIKKSNKNCYLYLYSRCSHYLKERYINKNPDFFDVSFKEIKRKPLSLEATNTIMANSDIIVDYTHPNQSGFTMRTCEAIGNKCKIVTNNKNIVKADFYNPNNILIYNEHNYDIPEYFIKLKYVELSDEIYERYSLTNWVNEIMSNE
jgi:glycosyltransferase